MLIDKQFVKSSNNGTSKHLNGKDLQPPMGIQWEGGVNRVIILLPLEHIIVIDIGLLLIKYY